MSTKIYDAYRLPDRTDPFALARTLGEEMMPVHRRLTLDALVERGVSPVPTGGWRGWLAGPLGGGAR